MLEFIFYIILGMIFGLFILAILEEGIGGGGISIRGTKKYSEYERNADEKVRNILKNGTGSSREELQEWWDKYHEGK